MLKLSVGNAPPPPGCCIQLVPSNHHKPGLVAPLYVKLLYSTTRSIAGSYAAAPKTPPSGSPGIEPFNMRQSLPFQAQVSVNASNLKPLPPNMITSFSAESYTSWALCRAFGDVRGCACRQLPPSQAHVSLATAPTA